MDVPIMRAFRACSRQCLRTSKSQKRSYSAPTDNSIPAAKQKYVPTSGTYPRGFLVGSAHAGVKASNTKFDDMAMIVSEKLCAGSALTTTNAFKAAPVNVTRRIIGYTRGKDLRGVVINSGCANAVTGLGGWNDAVAMAKQADACFAEPGSKVQPAFEDEENPLEKTKTLVMSTGVIGQRLPIDRIISTIPKVHEHLGNSHDHWLKTARAICTTDTFPKLISRQFSLPSHPQMQYSIAGMTKGAGMIHPNMATLLSIICTDAKIGAQALEAMLRAATAKSFNSISIDGDTSTNDTVAIFANGASTPRGIPPVTHIAPAKANRRSPIDLSAQSEDFQAMQAVLADFMTDLAKLVVRDGEGATKFVTLRVTGAPSDRIAEGIANSIVKSPLVKTALYGKDANWGRILCAIGYSPARYAVVPEWTSVSFIPTDGSEELKLLVKGEPEVVDEERAKKILEMEDLEILVRLDDGASEEETIAHRAMLAGKGNADPKYYDHGSGETVMWFCDFSHEYVTINGDYRT